MNRALTFIFAFALTLLASAAAQALPGWEHRGTVTILTTADGADLPAGVEVDGFPLLVRLHSDFFDFSQAKPGGDDLRITADGKPLPYQIDHWDAGAGEAAVWVRVPQIRGNARQELDLHWGNPAASSEADGKAVFDRSNGFLSVWHLGDGAVADVVGTLESEDKGTSPTGGMVGKARHFPGKAGVFCGDKIPDYPSADSAHTTALWFRSEVPNSTVIGWGNEGGGRGSKVRMQLRSPPHIHIDSDFSDIKGASRLPMNEWIHVVHTYGDGPRKLYINGKLDAEATTKLDIKSPGRLWLGGWYHNYDFIGDLDEVQISQVARGADWVRLQYENQKPLQTLVGPVVQPGAARFAVTPERASVDEGRSANFTAAVAGAQKIFWSVIRDGGETVAAVDRLSFRFDAGRVSGDARAVVRCKAVFADGVKVIDSPVTINESQPDPQFTLSAPASWDGRAELVLVPEVTNLAAMEAAGAGEVAVDWQLGGLAVTRRVEPGRLVLTRAQNSGELLVTATLSNGGGAVTQAVRIAVTEPQEDAWIARAPGADERPQDGQFYARDASGFGTLHFRGVFPENAASLFLRVYADGELYRSEAQHPGDGGAFAFAVQLKPGLIKYRVEFGSGEAVLYRAGDIVCGDAYLIDGQSNALATDTGEDAPRVTDEWVRSYAHPKFYREGEAQNLWCKPVWKAQQEHMAELGWWGMELAKQLVETQQVPIFMINGAVGGTRIDQHQRDAANPTDLETIYGRLLWRVREAKLTHGIRAILWHQGENDQGAAGPDGGYGWESYERYFVEMAGAWKQDFPNLQHYYIYQIFPNACSMGGGNGDRLREVQRSLPRLFSNMDVLSTLGIEPPGGCHFPLVGWAKFADGVRPLIERDFYGGKPAAPITAANLKQARFTSAAKDAVALEFDQPVIWDDALVEDFYLDGAKGQCASGSVSGNVVTLQLDAPSAAETITYLKEMSWTQRRLLFGENGLAALTFCEVPIRAATDRH